MKRITPYLLILFGLFLLFFIGLAEVAGVFILVGVVTIFEQFWPEEYEADKLKNNLGKE